MVFFFRVIRKLGRRDIKEKVNILIKYRFLIKYIYNISLIVGEEYKMR